MMFDSVSVNVSIYIAHQQADPPNTIQYNTF